jgi:hypothetical protein
VRLSGSFWADVLVRARARVTAGVKADVGLALGVTDAADIVVHELSVGSLIVDFTATSRKSWPAGGASTAVPFAATEGIYRTTSNRNESVTIVEFSIVVSTAAPMAIAPTTAVPRAAASEEACNLTCRLMIIIGAALLAVFVVGVGACAYNCSCRKKPPPLPELRAEPAKSALRRRSSTSAAASHSGLSAMAFSPPSASAVSEIELVTHAALLPPLVRKQRVRFLEADSDVDAADCPQVLSGAPPEAPSRIADTPDGSSTDDASDDGVDPPGGSPAEGILQVRTTAALPVVPLELAPYSCPGSAQSSGRVSSPTSCREARLDGLGTELSFDLRSSPRGSPRATPRALLSRPASAASTPHCPAGIDGMFEDTC